MAYNSLMIEFPQTCERCGVQGVLSTGERQWHGSYAQGEHMGFWEHFRCPTCGYSYDADGAPLYDALRLAIIAKEGEWVLEIAGTPSISLLKALREIRQLSLPELQALRARLPGVITRGTQTEIRYEAELLKNFGATDSLAIRHIGN